MDHPGRHRRANPRKSRAGAQTIEAEIQSLEQGQQELLDDRDEKRLIGEDKVNEKS